MTFDARSKERLESLGRTLPKKLPLPVPETPATAATPAAPRADGRRPGGDAARTGGARLTKPEAQRHALEREQDPAKLFRALITASADGSVPPHLLDRLRELEGARGPAAAGSAPSPTSAAGQALAPSPGTPSRKTAANGSPAGIRRSGGKASRIAANEDQDLYTAFAQLLLEDEEN
ncbi:MAG: hypothetical protein FJ083_00905 [Cyanobacteria bacterium K_Offshore_surface_m2_239]|nr:hypothetical protein [Cyanobacteria bacterium K_Offshore_surface_m2_239]